VNVFVEGQFSLALFAEIASRHALQAGVLLTPALLEELLGEEGDARARATALSFLSFRPRSVEEIKKRLAKDEWPEELIERVVAKLSEEGYLDDKNFARAWVNGRTLGRPRGSRKLQEELRQKGVSAPDIEAALPTAEVEIENARVALKALERRLEGLEERDARRKGIDTLMRKGFRYAAAQAAWAARREEE
jgi:regulatory protein